MEVVKLMEECSVAILNRLPEKDLGCLTITWSIGAQWFDHALCNLGASVSGMPKVIFDKLNFMHLAPTPMMLQLANSTVRYLARIVEDILVKIQGYFILVDFVVLDMETMKESPLILERPFLSSAGAQIDVGAAEIRFNITGKEEKFDFQPRQEHCSIIKNQVQAKPKRHKGG
jgi:hypothetical protein